MEDGPFRWALPKPTGQGGRKMAQIRRAADIRPKRETEVGWSNTATRMIAGNAQGCSNIGVRVLTIRPEGRMPRMEYPTKRIFFMLKGNLLFMDGDGAIWDLGEGDTVITGIHERHHIQNTSTSDSRVLIVDII